MAWLNDLAHAFDKTLFRMEATGLYCFTLTHFLAVIQSIPGLNMSYKSRATHATSPA